MDYVSAPPAKELFDAFWNAISAHGYCDTIGGAEYRRVLALWEEKGRPVDYLNFISFYANQTPTNGGCCNG